MVLLYTLVLRNNNFTEQLTVQGIAGCIKKEIIFCAAKTLRIKHTVMPSDFEIEYYMSA